MGRRQRPARHSLDAEGLQPEGSALGAFGILRPAQGAWHRRLCGRQARRRFALRTNRRGRSARICRAGPAAGRGCQRALERHIASNGSAVRTGWRIRPAACRPWPTDHRGRRVASASRGGPSGSQSAGPAKRPGSRRRIAPRRIAATPVHFVAAVDALQARDVERLFRPALAYREGLLARTLSFRKTPPPEWLASRRWEGRITAGEFALAGQKFSKLNARLVWNGASIDLAEVSAVQSGGLISGRGFVRAGPDGPTYELRGVFDSLSWEGHGTVEGEFGLKAAGLGDELLDSLNATGQVSSKRLEMGGDTFEQVAADFDYDGSRQPLRLRLSGATAICGRRSVARIRRLRRRQSLAR